MRESEVQSIPLHSIDEWRKRCTAVRCCERSLLWKFRHLWIRISISSYQRWFAMVCLSLTPHRDGSGMSMMRGRSASSDTPVGLWYGCDSSLCIALSRQRGTV